MSTVFIVNPVSANGTTGKRWPEVSGRISALGLEHTSVMTSAGGEATWLSAAALKSGADTVVAVGGDGTLNEVANGFFGEGQSLDGAAPAAAALGLLPFGTGGDCRRTLSIPFELEAAVECLKARRTRRIDVGRIEMQALDGGPKIRHFVNIADAGIGGVVVERVNRTTKFFGGKASFMYASLATLMSFKPQQVRVASVERDWEGRAQSVVVANCRYFGGGMHVAPGAEPDDGRFDMVVFGDIARFEAMRSMNDLYKADHLKNGKVATWRTSRVEVTSPERVLIDVDGELGGTLPAVFEILPASLSVVVP